jgi:hypothetical protein
LPIVEENAPVAALGVDWLQDREVAGKVDQTIDIDRRLVDIRDAPLPRSLRIDRKMRPPDEPFIRRDGTELLPICER